MNSNGGNVAKTGGGINNGIAMLPIAVILIAALAIWGIGAASGRHIAGRDLISAVVISIIGAGIGMWALMFTWHRYPTYLPQGVLAAMGLRIFVTLAGIFIFVLIFGPVELQFIFYMVGFYMAGLVCESMIALRLAKWKDNA
jgi:hypothetical protein